MPRTIQVGPPREAEVQRAILDLLVAERIFAIRVNTGAYMVKQPNGSARLVRSHYGGAGLSDILAFPQVTVCSRCGLPAPICSETSPLPCDGPGIRVGAVLWIECKRPGGRQTVEQMSFERRVARELFHFYLLTTSSEGVKRWLDKFTHPKGGS